MQNDRCFSCGGTVMWINSFSYEDCGIEGEGIVTFLTCSECGAEYEMYELLSDDEGNTSSEDEN